MFYTRFGERREKQRVICEKESRTKQSFREEVNVNNIVRKAIKNGMLPQRMGAEPHYGDFASVEDFQTSMNKVILAQEQFSLLPSHVRKRFGNDPSNFLDFVGKPENAEEMVKLGLATKKAKEEPLNVKVVSDDKKAKAVPKATAPKKVSE